MVVRGLADAATVARLRAVAERDLAACTAPLELEAETGYPGAPADRRAPGGETVRRLLQAYARDPVFREWATAPAIAGRLAELLGPRVALAQAHHNCVMTKNPGFSSVTGWHRDVRYWSFERPELVSVWTALGPERRDNGCLLVLPRSHRLELAAERLDDRQFLRAELPANAPLIAGALAVELDPGDVLFFHAQLFHAAGRNETDRTKYSLVFTYHAADNRPRPGTRSASLPDVLL